MLKSLSATFREEKNPLIDYKKFENFESFILELVRIAKDKTIERNKKMLFNNQFYLTIKLAQSFYGVPVEESIIDYVARGVEKLLAVPEEDREYQVLEGDSNLVCYQILAADETGRVDWNPIKKEFRYPGQWVYVAQVVLSNQLGGTI